MKRRTERSQYGLAGRRGGRRTEPIGIRGPGLAMLAAAHLIYIAAAAVPAPAAAMQILEAADHAELTAEISATGVNRIALAGDRIQRVIRSPGGFAVEHDRASGDLYLRPLEAAQSGPDAAAAQPVTLFVGTEKGFTYRLALTPAARDSAQILIRNADASAARDISAAAGDPGDPRVAALVGLVRAVARREPLPGYAIEAPAGTATTGGAIAETPEPFRIIETWWGTGAFPRPRFVAHVVEVRGAVARAADLAGTVPGLAGRIAAAWLAGPGTGPGGGRLAVVVTQSVELGGAEPGLAEDAP